jgi:chemotaxis protein CheC
MSPIKRPSYLRIDALREIGNIGAAHAVTGLSELLQSRVDISITNADIIPLQIIYTLFNGPESMVSVVYIEGYCDTFRGMMFLIFPHPEAARMVGLVSHCNVNEDGLSDEFSLSVLKEIGNIMCGCYLNTLAEFVGVPLMHSVPQISHDMLGAVMDSILIDLSLESDYALVLETAFTLTNGGCKGFLFFIPTQESLEMIFDKIAVE